MTQKCCDCWALTSVPGSSFLLGDIALSTATLQLPSRAVMADVYWKHGSQGFELRVSTRLTEVVVQSTRATSSIDVAFLDGLDESHVPPSPTPTEPSDTEGGAAAAAADVIVYSPICVRVKGFLRGRGGRDDGLQRRHARQDHDGGRWRQRVQPGKGPRQGVPQVSCAKVLARMATLRSVGRRWRGGKGLRLRYRGIFPRCP